LSQARGTVLHPERAGAHEAARRFLTAMIDADNREGVLRLIVRADRAAKPRS